MAAEPESHQTVSEQPYSVTVSTSFRDLEYNEEPVVQIVQSTLELEQCPGASIDIILVDDEYLRELKYEYFNEDAYTDVIAFRLNPYEEALVEGEIYISLHRAVEQAMEYDITADLELLRLAVHGTLHLLGYEDATDQTRTAMTQKEDRQLAQVGDPLIVTKIPEEP